MNIKVYIYAAMFFSVIGLISTGIYQYNKHGTDSYTAGYNVATKEMLLAVNEAAKIAKEDEQEKQGKINEAIQKQVDSERRINSQLNNDLDKLRKRASRDSQQAKGSLTTCKGTTGATLSSEDAGFLTREAARADTIRIGLKTCYHFVDTINKKN